jgi:hypothetical protein
MRHVASDGLGLMNMTYAAVAPDGELIGHEGLTYGGFHTRSSYNRKYRFVTTFAQNYEACHGVYHDPGTPDPIYNCPRRP